MYVSFFNGVHCHEKEQDDDRDTRSLSYEQKVIISDAFSKKIQSEREIKRFFRAEWIASKGTDREENFPLDPPQGKLKNYIQAYKRSNSVTYNPSSGVFNVFSSLASTVLGPSLNSTPVMNLGATPTQEILPHTLADIAHVDNDPHRAGDVAVGASDQASNCALNGIN